MATSKRFMVASLWVVLALISTRSARADVFDPVYATMTQPQGGDSPGCRGCHVGPAPSFGRWFGDTEADLLDYFTNGPGVTLVTGGRASRLAEVLGLVDGVNPIMPRSAPIDGRFWVDDPSLGLTELTDLGIWLDSLGL